MNEERKKYLRTQGKYSNMGKSKEVRKKNSPGVKEALEKKPIKRYSDESRWKDSSESRSKDSNERTRRDSDESRRWRSSNSFGDDVSPIKYEENSEYSFEKLEESRKAIEIIEPGKTVLSTTDNGESVILYEPELFDMAEADEFYERLYSSTDWYSKNIVLNGEEKPQPRLVAWYGPYPYSYSGATLEPAEMPDSVLEIKKKVEDYLKDNFDIVISFNSVLLNLYRNNKDGVAWHSDDELTLGISPVIASVSLGETRKFEMRPKKKYDDEKAVEKQDHYFILLTHGSLIVMDGSMQDDWQHRVPKEYHDKTPRINLTFRIVYPAEKVSHRVPEKEFKKKPVDVWVANKSSSSKITFNNEDFPPLSSDINIPVSSPNSGFRRDSMNSSSNSSVRNDELNQSSEKWDSEVLSEDSVKYSENLADDNDNSCELNSDESHIEDSVSPSSITEECISNEKSQKNWLNVAAKEFIPKKAVPVPSGNYFFPIPDFSRFTLEELLHYEVKVMSMEKLIDFSSHLKARVQERLQEFREESIREELEFLCLLTDGTQTEKNQKLISSRIVTMASNYFERLRQKNHNHNRRSWGERNYGEQNNYVRRYNQNYGKNNFNR